MSPVMVCRMGETKDLLDSVGSVLVGTILVGEGKGAGDDAGMKSVNRLTKIEYILTTRVLERSRGFGLFMYNLRRRGWSRSLRRIGSCRSLGKIGVSQVACSKVLDVTILAAKRGFQLDGNR